MWPAYPVSKLGRPWDILYVPFKGHLSKQQNSPSAAKCIFRTDPLQRSSLKFARCFKGRAGSMSRCTASKTPFQTRCSDSNCYIVGCQVVTRLPADSSHSLQRKAAGVFLDGQLPGMIRQRVNKSIVWPECGAAVHNKCPQGRGSESTYH